LKIIITFVSLINYKDEIMNTVAGITIERNKSGQASYARIDLEKYGKLLMPFFRQIGMEQEESFYNPEFVAKIEARKKEESIAIDYHNVWK
jgi:hypothetical protein